MAKFFFSFETRQAMSVAMVVAEEVVAHTRFGFPIGSTQKAGQVESRPVLLSVTGTTFRFEGGTVAKVKLVGSRDPDDHNMMTYGVTSCVVRYYPIELPSWQPSPVKVEETWGWEMLLQLRAYRPWWHPPVASSSVSSEEIAS